MGHHTDKVDAFNGKHYLAIFN